MAEPGDPGEPLRREHVGEADSRQGLPVPQPACNRGLRLPPHPSCLTRQTAQGCKGMLFRVGSFAKRAKRSIKTRASCALLYLYSAPYYRS